MKLGSRRRKLLFGAKAAVFDTAVQPPIITSSGSVNCNEDATLAHVLTANESVTWSIVGGADSARFEISGSTLRWLSNGVKDYENPNDANADNVYVVTVRATDLSAMTKEATVNVTVLDVAEALIAPTLSLTSANTDTTPDFTLIGDLILSDTVRFQYSTAADFTGASELTNTIDAGEDAANSITFTTGALALGTWYFRARVERPVVGNSSWSNTVVDTIIASYTGPGDIVAGAVGWWGLRAYTAAKIGTAAIRVRRSTGEQQDILIAANGIINTADAFFNGSTPYEIVKLYDQATGTKNIDVAVVTATYPILLLNDNGTLPAIQTLSAMESTNPSADMAQPTSVVMVARRASFGGVPNQLTYAGSAPLLIQFDVAANGVSLYAGLQTIGVPAADGATHAIAGLFNSTASKISIDGSVTTGLNPGASSSGVGAFRFTAHVPDGTVKAWECGYWVSDISASFAALSANQHTVWSF